MKDVIVICEDIFGLEILSILEDCNRWQRKRGLQAPYSILGYISEKEKPFGDLAENIHRLGDIEHWTPTGDEWLVMGIKMPERKKAVAEQMKARGCKFETVAVPWMIAGSFPIGEGSVIAAYSVLPGMTIGRFVTIIGAMFSHHFIGDYSTVMHFANVTGDVGTCSYIGNHAYTHFEKRVGDHCYIEDGAIVINHVKDGTYMAGVPARKIKR